MRVKYFPSPFPVLHLSPVNPSTLRGRLVCEKEMEWNQGIISGELEMELDSFFNVFGGEEEWNQIIILIICLWVIEVN